MRRVVRVNRTHRADFRTQTAVLAQHHRRSRLGLEELCGRFVSLERRVVSRLCIAGHLECLELALAPQLARHALRQHTQFTEVSRVRTACRQLVREYMPAQKSTACHRFEVVFCQQLAHFGKRVVIRSAAVGNEHHRRCTLTVQAASKVRRNLVRQPTGIHRTAEYDQLIRGKLILLRTVRRRVE